MRCDDNAPNPPPPVDPVLAIEAKPPLPLPNVLEPNELDAPAADEPKADWPNPDEVETGCVEDVGTAAVFGSAVSEPKNVNRFDG